MLKVVLWVIAAVVFLLLTVFSLVNKMWASAAVVGVLGAAAVASAVGEHRLHKQRKRKQSKERDD